MKKIMIIVSVAAFAGCATVNTPVNNPVPEPPSARLSADERIRDVASSEAYVQSAYNTYFNGQNFYQRVVKIENIAAQLHAVMPEKGHAKKKLVGRFLRDVKAQKKILQAIPSSASDRTTGWLPSAQSGEYSRKVNALGNIAASYKIMTRMGIYLTASGVFNDDSGDEDFYLRLLDRAGGDIENALRTAVLAYKPEDAEANEAAARLTYARSLAGDVRLALTRVYPDRGSDYRRLDAFFRRLTAADRAQARILVRGADGRFAGEKLKTLHVMNSGDIQGFADEVDLTLSTKFGFEMIRHLVAAE